MGCHVLCAAWLLCDTQLLMILWRLERTNSATAGHQHSVSQRSAVRHERTNVLTIKTENYHYFQLHLPACVTSYAETCLFVRSASMVLAVLWLQEHPLTWAIYYLITGLRDQPISSPEYSAAARRGGGCEGRAEKLPGAAPSIFRRSRASAAPHKIIQVGY